MTGRQAIGFGLLFLALSLPLFLIALQVIPVRLSRGVPHWVVEAVASCFMAISLLMLVLGIRATIRSRRRRALLQQRPGEVWFADFSWDPERQTDDNLPRLIRHLAMGAFMFCFLAPFNWWAFVSEHGNWIVVLVVSLFDLVMLLAVGVVCYRSVQLLKFGRSYLRFGDFPYRLGEPLVVAFGMGHDLRSFDRIRFRLRFVVEKFETTGSGNDRSTTVVADQVWGEEQVLESTDLGLLGEAEVSFELPAESPGMLTSLSERPPSYWEMEVRCEAIGIDYQAVFPLPVYLPARATRPATERAGERATEHAGERGAEQAAEHPVVPPATTPRRS